MSTPPRRDHRPGLVTPAGNDVAATWSRAARRAQRRRADRQFRRQRLPRAHRRGGQGTVDAGRGAGHRRPQAAQVRQPLAPLRAGGRRAGVCRRRHPPDARTRPRAGAASVGTGMMGVTFDELAQVQQRQRAANGELEPDRLLGGARLGRRPDGVLPQPVQRRCGAADAASSASAAMPPRCTPPAPPAARRSAPR